MVLSKVLPMNRFLVIFFLSACLSGLSSCRLALHTLPESVGKQNFNLQTESGETTEVFSCGGVLYVRVTGSFSSPPVALMENYDLKYGDWVFVPESGKKTEKESQVSFFLPMDAELVRLWNTRADNQAPLRFEKYQAEVLTEAEMAAKGGTRVTKGQIHGCGLLAKHIQEAATRKHWSHYAMMPLTVPLEMVDALSAIPLTGAAFAGAAVVAPVGMAVSGVYSMVEQKAPSPRNEQAPE